MATGKKYEFVSYSTTLQFSVGFPGIHSNITAYEKFLRVYTDAYYFHLQQQDLRQKNEALA